MDQYTNYFDALSQSMQSQQPNDPSPFPSQEPHPPSLSASPVSSEGSDSLIDEAIRYGLFTYDHSPAAIYSSYNQNSVNDFVAGSTPMNDHSSIVVKHEDSFGYEAHMMFDGGIAPSLTAYQPLTGYATQECNPIGFDYLAHSNTVTNFANMLTEATPFATVAPSATSGLTDEETSAHNLSTEIAELSISSSQAEGSHHSISSPNRGPTADRDYSPSGESEVEDENDHSYGEPQHRRKTRSARVSYTAHPYLRPAPKAKSNNNKRRGTKLELPVPVPGLTKNSRGRNVPKKTEVATSDGSRPFWCDVKDCDKLFGRGEHLKRHISSIHTQDRPFQCECKSVFSRRDNLFQHMRSKGCMVWYKDGVRQGEPSEPDEKTKAKMDAEDAAEEDRLIKRIMADAEKAREKRDRFCKQARSGF